MADDGKVGIGTTNPDGALTIQATGASDITYKYTDGNTKAFSKFDNLDFTFKEGTVGNDAYAFFTANTERMRIDSSGNVLMGSTSTSYSYQTNSFRWVAGVSVLCSRNTTADTNQIAFFNPNGAVGSINTNGSATAYNTSSDYRLKENVDYDFDATTRLKQLKPARFNFIADADTTVDGFIAHEVSDIVPEAITGEKDATKVQDVYDDDGNVTGTETVPDYQGIDQSKLVPLLVKTIQELEARITALENN
jgi:hypothetical protein